MIISRLKGGLANQIFQWAHGMNLAIASKTQLYLDISFYLDQTGCTPREFSLHKFPNLKFSIFNGKEFFENQNRKFSTIKINEGDHFLSEEIPLHRELNYHFEGYWGSEKYFIEIKDRVKECLSYNQDFVGKISNSKYRGVFSNNSVSIHVRRTDYLNSRGYHPVLPMSYYIDALKKVKEYDSIYIFSDDIEWCKENMDFPNSVFVENLEDVEDMWLMSLCKNNIIANSTFSWWGAWLNKNPDKIVVSPKKWLGPAEIDESNIIPGSWIKI